MKLEGFDFGGIIDLEDGYELCLVFGLNVFFILKKRCLNDEDKCCYLEVC